MREHRKRRHSQVAWRVWAGVGICWGLGAWALGRPCVCVAWSVNGAACVEDKHHGSWIMLAHNLLVLCALSTMDLGTSRSRRWVARRPPRLETRRETHVAVRSSARATDTRPWTPRRESGGGARDSSRDTAAVCMTALPLALALRRVSGVSQSGYRQQGRCARGSVVGAHGGALGAAGAAACWAAKMRKNDSASANGKTARRIFAKRTFLDQICVWW